MNEAEMKLGELPHGWMWSKLGDILSNNGKSIIPSKSPDELFELYSVPKYDNGSPEIVYGKQIGSNKQIVEKDAVLLCKINPRINRVWVVGDYSPYQKIASTEWIPFFKRDGIDPKYLCYFMNNDYFRDFLSSNASGVGGSLMRVKAATLSNYPIPIAPLSEQHCIVACIEELFSRLGAGVEALHRAKAQLRRYRQAVLKAAMEGRLTEEWRKEHPEVEPAKNLLDQLSDKLGRREKSEIVILDLPEIPQDWIWANIGEIGNVSGGLTKNSKRNGLSLRMPYLRVANVYADKLRLEEMKEIGLGENELDRSLLNPGDLLIVEGNGSPDQIGRVALWDGSISPCVHQNHIIKVRFNPTSIGRYVLYWLLSVNGRERISKVASSTSGLYTLSISKVASLSVPLPSLPEQEKIINEIESRLSISHDEEKTIDLNLKLTDRLRQSILKCAFEGRLVPQDPNDEPASVLLDRIKYEKAVHAPRRVRKTNRNKTHQMRLTQ